MQVKGNTSKAVGPVGTCSKNLVFPSSSLLYPEHVAGKDRVWLTSMPRGA